jgi:hypothetical protein
MEHSAPKNENIFFPSAHENIAKQFISSHMTILNKFRRVKNTKDMVFDLNKFK